MNTQDATLPKIYALFVGINDYPENPLDGPVNDARSLRDQLATLLGERLVAKTLTNQEASYDKLVEAFTHFDQATASDQCLFFYAGHGTRLDAPEPFWSSEPDKKNDAFVCHYDEETPRRYLIDKELGYLIWRVSAEKKILFTLIIDACHAKGLYRGGNRVKERFVASTGTGQVPLEEYLGHEHYVKNGIFQPLPRRQVFLAAAQGHETAKEEYNFQEGCSRGIFSYRLQKCLIVAQGLITYLDLMNRVVIGVRNESFDQAPELIATHPEDKNLLFLGNSRQASPEEMLVAWREKLGWTVNRGSLHGIFLGPAEQPTKIGILETNEVFEVTEVLPDAAKLGNVTTLQRGKIYPASLMSSPVPKFTVAIAEDGDPAASTLLRRKLETTRSQLFRLVATDEGPDYLLHAKDNSYFLTPGDINPTEEETKNNLPAGRPLFARVKGYGWSNIKLFIARLESVLKWRSLLTLQNPGSHLPADRIRIILERTTGPVTNDEETPLEVVDWRSSTTLTYHLQNEHWHPPGFRLSVENTTGRRLYISALYLAADYCIENSLMDNESLPSGGKASVAYVDKRNNQRHTIIPVFLEDHYQDWGKNRIHEYVKVIVSTIPFSTDNFRQDGLPQEQPTRGDKETSGLGISNQPLHEDWTSFDVSLEILHPGV